MNNIKTITQANEEKLREKGSLFIGKAYPAGSEEEIIKILREIKKKYFDATHHCYAYKIFPGDAKYSDAGEPSGTAGIRILNAIEHFGLTNILIAVVRYFGGTKLGTGPLGKAYYNCTALTLGTSEMVDRIPVKKVYLEAELSFANQVQKILASNKVRTLNTKFEEKMSQEFLINMENIEQLLSRLRESTKNSIEINVDSRIFFV
jgi:uncharacterized YigZ family protein